MARCLPDLVPGPIREVTGTNYTLALGDEVNGIITTSDSPVAILIDKNANVKFARYIRIPLREGGAGAITVQIVAGSGVILKTPNGTGTTADGDSRVLEQEDIDVWRLW